MARNEQLEKLLAARFEFDHCEVEFKAKAEAKLNAVVDALLAKTHYSRMQIFEATSEPYQAFCRAQWLEDRRRSST